MALGGSFLYGLFTINSVINPNDVIYKDDYLDDETYDFIFLDSPTYA